MNVLSSSFLSPLSINPKIAGFPLTPSSPAIPRRRHNYFYQPLTLKSKTSSSSKSGTQNIFNAVDCFIEKHEQYYAPPSSSSSPPDYFAPVDELPPTECTDIQGSLPSSLDGAYIRNGPNPQFAPPARPYHLFDGDGMLHSIRISGGKAIFCSRFVRTYKYTTERKAGRPLIPAFFSDFRSLGACAAGCAVAAARILTGKFNPANGMGTANTSLAVFGGKLLALSEGDLPYAIKLDPDGDIITLGRHDFEGMLQNAMTAHPKMDPETREVFAFRYGPIFPPFLTFFRIKPDGTKQPDVKIYSMDRPTFLHDFAITKNYAIFPDIQIELYLWNLIVGKLPIGFDKRKVTRVGVIPRYAKDESGMKWFDVPGLNNLHTINAWEEDDGETVVIVATNILSVEHLIERMDLVYGSVEKVKIDLKTGRVLLRHPVATKNLEVAVINPAYVGKKNRYIYAAIGSPMPKFSGLVKLDLSLSESKCCDCMVSSRLYGPGHYGGEPFFVAKDSDDLDADEDDGYVVCYVHDENKGESRFLVMDAKSQNLEILATVKLPQRVPYGFHGLFIRESDLNKL